MTNLSGHFLSPVWIFPLLFWWVNQIKINNVSKYQVFVWFPFFKDLMIGLIFIDSHTGSDKFLIFSNISNFYVWNLKENEIRQKTGICWHCLFWFGLPFRKEEGKFKQGTKNVRQGLSKVFVFFTYSSYSLALVHSTSSWLVLLELKCTICHDDRSKWPKNHFKPVQRSRQQMQRGYCPAIYTLQTNQRTLYLIDSIHL